MPEPQEQGTVNQANVLFTNLNQQVENLITTCNQANQITLQHMQNSITTTEQSNKMLLEQMRLGWGDCAKSSREIDVSEATANRVLGQLTKLPDADYLLGMKSIIDFLITSQPTPVAT